MKKEIVLAGLSFFLVMLLASSFAGLPLEPIPGRTCWEWRLNEIESKDLVSSSLVWNEFVESDGMTVTSVGGDSFKVQLTIPDGLHFYSKLIPNNKLCPKGKASTCGHYDCADVYLGSYDKPVLRVELDNFKDDDETDIILSGYGVGVTVNAGEIKLRNTVNTYKHYLHSDAGKKLWRFGISGNEDDDKLLKVVRSYVTVHDKDLVSILEGGTVPGAGLKLTPSDFNKAEPKKIDFEFTAPEAFDEGYLLYIVTEPLEKTEDEIIKMINDGDLDGKLEPIFVSVDPNYAKGAVLKGSIEEKDRLDLIQDLDKGKYFVYVGKVIVSSPSKALVGTFLTTENEIPATPCDKCETILECLACIDQAFVKGVFKE